MLLGVNIDHIAVLREARKINDPDPLDALSIVKRAGADQITIHLREDRRHIDDYDTEKIIEISSLPINLECSLNSEIIDIVCSFQPHRATLVPEKREEVTTEGGLDLKSNFNKLRSVVNDLKDNDIEVSLFIDPDLKMVELAKELDVDMVEFHTGSYANIYAMLYSNLANTKHSIKELELSRSELKLKLIEALKKIEHSAKEANRLEIKVAAGHGLNYQNVNEIVKIKEIIELNIGQSIIARSVFTGLESAVREMRELIRR